MSPQLCVPQAIGPLWRIRLVVIDRLVAEADHVGVELRGAGDVVPAAACLVAPNDADDVAALAIEVAKERTAGNTRGEVVAGYLEESAIKAFGCGRRADKRRF
jgi:hypothetical protein